MTAGKALLTQTLHKLQIALLCHRVCTKQVWCRATLGGATSRGHRACRHGLDLRRARRGYRRRRAYFWCSWRDRFNRRHNGVFPLSLRVASCTELPGDLVGLLDHTTEFVIWDTFAGAHTNGPCDEFEERLGTQEAGHAEQTTNRCQSCKRGG
jgi:hypothetical protein